MLFSRDTTLLLDGAMGTMLQKAGLRPGANGELLCLTEPDAVLRVHRSYAEAGSRVLLANTFGANRLKLAGTGHSAAEVIGAAVRIARRAADGAGALVALDVGPLGALLEPLGSLGWEEAYDCFAEMMRAGADAGADCVFIETMTDLSEARAALLAAKEQTGLPVAVTMSFEASGRTFTGCTPAAAAVTLTGLGADAVGCNCSVGPADLLPVIRKLREHTRLPVIAKPNAGLPDPLDGSYSLSAEDFAAQMAELIRAGANLVGGCCGTDPSHIRALAKAVEGVSPAPSAPVARSCVCTPTVFLPVDRVRVVGERINPTGKKRLQQALREGRLDAVAELAVQQADAGAEILDVNVGAPGVDEAALLPRAVKAIQAVSDIPLQLDSADPDALEAALRVYCGKAVVNSVSGKRESLRRVLPIVKKYGAAVIGLAMDDDGLPSTAEDRLRIARRILEAAMEAGIPREDVWIDCLTLTVSAQQEQARETLRAVRLVREELGLSTVLGVSNVSFGLPARPIVTATFLSAALAAGLDLPIVNPNQREAMDTIAAWRALSGEDPGCAAYIDRLSQSGATAAQSPAPEGLTLDAAIRRGLQAEAARLAAEELRSRQPLEVISEVLIPALDAVGREYAEGRAFLPQLLSAAQAAQAVSAKVRDAVRREGGDGQKRGLIALATVEGDVHDIGKNIVKTVLENYGWDILDLGRDVPPETIAERVQEQGVKLVGLAALMTTTLPAMERTVRLLHSLPDRPAVFVGGAVVTQAYAEEIGADAYAADALAAVAIARRFLG